MSCKELHKTSQSQVEVKCRSIVCNSKGSCTKSTHSLDCVPTITSSDKHKTDCNFGSSTNLNKISLYTSEGESKNFSNEINVRKCSNDDVRGDDVNDIQSTASNFRNTRCKNTKEDIKSDALKNMESDTLNDVPFPVNIPSSEHDQANVVECLLDLDDYLEKMDNDCFIDPNLNKSTVVLAKGIHPFLRKNNSSKTNSQFKRSSKLRNTINCTFQKQKMAPEREFTSIYGTWQKKASKSSFHQQENQSTTTSSTLGTYVDIDREMPQCSNNINKSGSSESTDNSTYDVENECANNSGLQVLTNDQIFQNLIEQQQSVENDRPRQFGRRAERLNNSTQNFAHVNYDNLRPISAPVSTSISEVCYHNEIYAGSDGSTTRTSCNTTPVSIESSTDSGESLVITDAIDEENITVNEENDQQSSDPMDPEIMKSGFNTFWPYSCSRTLALISCTLGLFNISRFAIVTINYGGNFLIQFLILSIIFGIPFLWLQMSLGAKIEAGPISMWKISPICIGIGISITFVQYFITIYSSVAVVWLFIYIQDIFVNKSSYPWAESIHPIVNRKSPYTTICTNLTESIPDYLNVNVLQRIQILKISDENRLRLHINDRLAFYMVLLWTVVFLVLCKGLKSFGKFVLLLGILPIILLAVVAVKLLCVVDFVKLQNVFSSAEFDDFLVNSKTWTAAAQEAFLTWGLFGASIITISSRKHRKSSELALRKDAILVVLATLIGLCLSALIGLCSIQILNESGFIYVPGSYENPKHYSAIFSLKSLTRSDLISYPTEFVPHYSTLIGEVYRRHTDTTNVSGYQVLRFVTEVLPAAVAISIENISWIWTSIIFIAFLLFGVSQLCVMWKPISCALGNSSSAVLMSCVTGLLLSIPFATEIGITLLYYMDILLGGAWFIPVLWSAEIFGVFLIRGRPYNGDDLVNDLKMSGSMSAFLALTWNILLPIGLVTLAIIEYKISLSDQLYHWRGKSYFNYWSRKAGAFTQIAFLILIPISAIIQICRYLTSGPPDILDRIQMLYRPLDEVDGIEANDRINRNAISRYHENNTNSANQRSQDDAPPKYTPPPSYTTATGARLAKILRQSIRRSIRRVLGETQRPRSIPFIQHETQIEQTSPSVLTTEEASISISESIEFENRSSLNLLNGRSLSLGRKQILNKRHSKEANELPLSNHCNSYKRSLRKFNNRQYTAEDVITILRSSTLGRRRNSLSGHLQAEPTFRSIENLIHNSEPPNLSSPIIDDHSSQNGHN